MFLFDLFGGVWLLLEARSVVGVLNRTWPKRGWRPEADLANGVVGVVLAGILCCFWLESWSGMDPSFEYFVFCVPFSVRFAFSCPALLL